MLDTRGMEFVGSGYYGVVYRYGDKAVKEIDRCEDSGPLMEMVIMSMDIHPNIMRVDSIYGDENSIQLVMPYIPRTLYRISMRELDGCIDTIIDAMAHLHSMGIIHRDLKPANILATDDGVPYIIDFSLAIMNDSAVCYVCSDGYRPPEVMAGSRYGTPVDVWSLGAIIYRIMYGISLPTGNDIQAIIDEVGATDEEVDRFMRENGVDGLKAAPCPIVGDERLHHLCRSMLKINPSDRPSFNDMRKKGPIPITRPTIPFPLSEDAIISITTETNVPEMWDEALSHI